MKEVVREKGKTVVVDDARIDRAEALSPDDLMELVGELMVGHARIHRVILEQKKRMTAEETAAELDRIADHLSCVVNDLQECVLKAKMLPARGLLRRVAGVAGKRGDEIGVELEGEDTEVDGDILKELEAPLADWVRKRSAAKQLKLSITNEDNLAVVRAFADGIGLPAEASEPLRAVAERLGGLIGFESHAGERESVRLQLPLTNAMFFGQLVKLHDQLFMLPMSGIEGVAEVRHGELGSSGERQTFRWGDRTLPVFWPHRLLRIPRVASAKESVPLVVAGIGERRFALAVDELYWSQEVRMKSLGDCVGRAQGIAGSTMLAGGKVALIIDMRDLAELVLPERT